ncbi:MAG: DNA primase, partial [Gemmatimonadota bacterium]
MIPDEIVEQVRDAADLVEIVGESVQLKRTGTDFRGPCPFHGGTNRNFSVIPKKGMYYCFVCHEAGDVFRFLMKKSGMDYPTAVREVARRTGITIPERAAREGPDPREPLFSAMSVAHEWFAARLREGPDAVQARTYLEGRDFPMPVAAELGFGYAPTDGSFMAAMKQLGLAEPVLLEAGLLVSRDDGMVVPRFKGRLLFPIRDLRGRVVALGGRLLRPGEPKYLNSPESPIFHKGGTLYNLHDAKNAIRREGEVLLVEGYFDVLRLAVAGIEHVVASLGTAFTSDQAALLKRFAAQAVVLYDSDKPGLKATFRAANELLRHGVRVRVATMPPGEDPDTLVRGGGAAALAPILKDAVDVLERMVHLLEVKGWLHGVEHRRGALDRLLPTIRAASDPITRDLYIGLVAEKFGMIRAVLEHELESRPVVVPDRAQGAKPPAAGPAASASGHRAPPRAAPLREGARFERQLLRVFLAEPAWLDRARTEVPAASFEVAAHR